MPVLLSVLFRTINRIVTFGFGNGAGIGTDFTVMVGFLSDAVVANPSEFDDFFFRLSFSISSSTSLSQFALGSGAGTHSRAIYFLCSYLARMNDSNAESVCGRRKPSGSWAS